MSVTDGKSLRLTNVIEARDSVQNRDVEMLLKQ